MSTQHKKIAYRLGAVLLCSLLLIWAFVPAEKPVDYLNRVDASVGTYVQHKEFGELALEMKYTPPTYLAVGQLVRARSTSDDTFEELKEAYTQSTNFVLRLKNKNGGALVKSLSNSMNGYQELVHYLSFDIQEDLKLCTSRDTVNCSFVHFERNYDLAPFTNIEIGFDNTALSTPLSEQQEWSVLFNADRLGLGPLFFRYETNTVNEQPSFSF